MIEYFGDHYEIQRELGRGAFGVVCLARDTQLYNRQVALEILHPVLTSDPGVVRLFQTRERRPSGRRSRDECEVSTSVS